MPDFIYITDKAVIFLLRDSRIIGGGDTDQGPGGGEGDWAGGALDTGVFGAAGGPGGRVATYLKSNFAPVLLRRSKTVIQGTPKC